MKTIGVLLLVIVAGYFVIRFAYLRPYSEMTTDFVNHEYENIHSEVTERDQNLTVPMGGVPRLNEMRRDAAWMWMEKNRRQTHADFWIPILGVLGFLFLVLPKFRFSIRPKRIDLPRKRETEVRISEANPREEYVDEYEFARKAEGGFKSREEAVEWLSRDPLLNCDYCGAKLKATFQAGQGALEFVTFYKKVPEGAKDLRIVLGARWYTRAATELKCTGCDRVIHR